MCIRDSVYPVGAEAKKYTIEHNKCVLSVNEDVIKGDIEIIKPVSYTHLLGPSRDH